MSPDIASERLAFARPCGFDNFIITTTEKIELSLIPALSAGFWLSGSSLPDHIVLGKLLLAASALLLLQSLVRDVWLLASARRKANTNSAKVARCMCVESMIGITGIAVGLLLLTCELGQQVVMKRWSWGVFALLVFGAGFLIKDYVMEFKPWRIRRDKDHLNIVVKWKT